MTVDSVFIGPEITSLYLLCGGEAHCIAKAEASGERLKSSGQVPLQDLAAVPHVSRPDSPYGLFEDPRIHRPVVAKDAP